MPRNDGRPGEGSRGAANDHRIADEISTDGSRPHRRGAATWAQRHRSRVDRIFSGLDPWTDDRREWSDSELRAVELAAEHLRSLNLYGGWQCPESARRAWQCQRCPCQRRQVA
jgi:hypothetical protein